MDEPRWTIEELGRQVEAALSVGYHGPINGQIRAIPNARTIRYYTTLGLVDRPAEMRGRTAHYSTRHLLQLVAIKRLQESGAALSDVQARLGGLTDRQLAAIARVPAPARPPAPAPAPASAPERNAFWAAMPAALAPPSPEPAEPTHPADEPAIAAPIAMTHIALAPGVVLMFTPDRAVGAADARAVADAAGPLVHELQSRGLIRAA